MARQVCVKLWVDVGECGLFKPKQEGYYVVVLKSHEAIDGVFLVPTLRAPNYIY